MTRKGKFIGAVALLALLAGLLPREEPAPVMSAASVASEAAASVTLPVIMYHSIYATPKEPSAYVLSPAAFEADLQWLLGHGYTPVRADAVLAWWEDGEALPEKPVLLTFDDGFYNYLPGLLPILMEYDIPAVVSVVGEYVEAASGSDDRHPAYAYLSWDDLRRLLASGQVELGNHSYAMHGLEPRLGVSRMNGEPEDAYRAALTADTERMEALIAEHLGLCPRVYAFPYGAMSRGTGNILRELGYEMLLTCEERGNVLTRGDGVLPKLGRYNRDAGLSTEAFMAKMGL